MFDFYVYHDDNSSSPGFVGRLDDSTVCFTITYLLDNDLSAGYCYLPLTELGPDL